MGFPIGAVIAGASALSGLLGGKKSEASSGWSVDPATMEYINWIRKMTQSQFAPQMMQWMAALSGDEGALRNMAGPSTDFMRPVFNRQRDMAYRRASDLATQSGAYGGSRQYAVVEPTLLRDINEQEQMFEYQGLRDTLQRAMGLMGLAPGFMSLGAQPTGQTNKQQMSRNPWAGFLGGALSTAPYWSWSLGGGGGGTGPGQDVDPNAWA